MDLRLFSQKNRERCESPQGFNHKLTDWSLSDWITAITGELGEAANIVKKLNRIRDGVAGNKESETESALLEKFKNELADVAIYLNLIFQRQGSDMGSRMVQVFNAKSEQLGCPIRYDDKAKPSGENVAPYKALESANHHAFVGNDVLRAAARELFQRLPMTRAFDSDYDNAVSLLRRVYDMGRARGVVEAGSG